MSESQPRLQQFLEHFGQNVMEAEHRVLGAVKRVPHLKHDHPPVRNANELMKESFTPLERVALFVTHRISSVGFFMTIATWSAGWLLWNTLAPAHEQFDPAPAFVM